MTETALWLISIILLICGIGGYKISQVQKEERKNNWILLKKLVAEIKKLKNKDTEIKTKEEALRIRNQYIYLYKELDSLIGKNI